MVQDPNYVSVSGDEQRGWSKVWKMWNPKNDQTTRYHYGSKRRWSALKWMAVGSIATLLGIWALSQFWEAFRDRNFIERPAKKPAEKPVEIGTPSAAPQPIVNPETSTGIAKPAATSPPVIEHGPSKGVAHVPIVEFGIFGYGIMANIGTPPQPAMLTLDTERRLTWVQSSLCASQICQTNMITPYNSSLSASYQPGDEKVEFMVPNAGAVFTGNLSHETIGIGDLRFENQEFVEMFEGNAQGFISLYYGYDGGLGLGPKTKEEKRLDFTNINVSSSWESFTNSKKLDRNVFSLTLPLGPQNLPTTDPSHTGELVFGGLPEGCKEDDAIKLPLQENWPLWATSLESFTLEGDFTATFKNGTAMLSASNPLILFPSSITTRIKPYLGRYESVGVLTVFDCTKRDGLPDMTFGIGGQKMTIKSDQYTWKMAIDEKGAEKCFIALSKDDSFSNVIALGTTFLKNYKTTFDQDSKQVLLWPRR